ncbi:MAG: hypothetical protein C5S49_07465 [Candidatus Methanogaster sp.]|nr:MAG: hypothetical protein C5S49_07465 [ANME-2 cluster archaeon]
MSSVVKSSGFYHLYDLFDYNYAKDAINYSGKLIPHKIGVYGFRIGDYRVVFDIDGNDVVVLRIGHGKSIYR